MIDWLIHYAAPVAIVVWFLWQSKRLRWWETEDHPQERVNDAYASLGTLLARAEEQVKQAAAEQQAREIEAEIFGEREDDE